MKNKLFTMKNSILKFLTHLLIVVLGVLISFSIEKERALSYKEDLKNNSLRKMISNISHDINDQKINYEIHNYTKKCTKHLLNNSKELFHAYKDSLGYYIKIVSSANSIFIDNKEEYLTLRNSGLLELIENDSLVYLLHHKYSYHQFYKKLEDHISEINHKIQDNILIKTSYVGEGMTKYWGQYGLYIDSEPLTNTDLLLVKEKFGMSDFYCLQIKNSMKRDSVLIDIIKQELSDKK